MKKISYILIILLFISFSSCKKKVEISDVQTDGVFKTILIDTEDINKKNMAQAVFKYTKDESHPKTSKLKSPSRLSPKLGWQKISCHATEKAKKY
jgi:hypothetical protein